MHEMSNGDVPGACAVNKGTRSVDLAMQNEASGIWLARHGETDDNAHGLILGRRDPPLNEGGIVQARQLASNAASLGARALWTSPLRRARETADIVGVALGLKPIVLADLAESDRGDWEGRTRESIAASSPELYAAFLAADPGFGFPAGETFEAHVARARSALDAMASGREPALAITHVGTIRAAMRAVGRGALPEHAYRHGAMVALPRPR